MKWLKNRKNKKKIHKKRKKQKREMKMILRKELMIMTVMHPLKMKLIRKPSIKTKIMKTQKKLM
jgi:hypothetical protein